MALKLQTWMRIEGDCRKEEFPSQQDRLLAPNWDLFTFMKPEWQKPGGHSVADLDNAQSPAAPLKHCSEAPVFLDSLHAQTDCPQPHIAMA